MVAGCRGDKVDLRIDVQSLIGAVIFYGAGREARRFLAHCMIGMEKLR